ncbi:MAG: beta-eliminating lyase-related protein [Acidobacteriota bacterium]|nr:beta-eliminating lyase-related protein [Acidobacteriota bacterium]
MQRRSFLATPLAALQVAPASPDARVYAYGDGIPHTPEAYAELLARLASKGQIAPDSYSRGGAVEKLETRMASLLGKEAAVWLPTGTLANHLAVRLLAGSRKRVLVQSESHLYRDSGDCAQTLSGLNLIPLAPGKAAFTLEEVERAANDSSLGRVATPVGAIQIETPVRRLKGQRFDFGEMKKIAAWARANDIRLHLDGARLFLDSAYASHPLRDYTTLFDTVYVSLYKYFNAASGAILAGPKTLLAGMYHTRRMFGGGLPQVWPFAAVALHYLDGFERRFRAAVKTSENVISLLGGDANFQIERVPNGSNIFRMRTTGVNVPVYHGRLEDAGISAAAPVADWFTLHVNETWNRASAAEIAGRFRKALG